MATANDLMGLGMPPTLSNIIAEAGTGVATLTPAGSSFATATRIKVGQSMVQSSTDGTTGIALPAVGTSTGVLIGDIQFVTNTSATTTLPVWGSSGVIIYGSQTQHSCATVDYSSSAIFFPLSSTAWGMVGV